MSFNRIYGIGNTPNEALIYAKVNEIGHNTRPNFLRKTQIKYLEYSNNSVLELKLITTYLIRNVNRELTTTELNARNDLLEYYGKKELNTIMDIFGNVNSDITVCFLDSKSNDYNLYKFLY